MVEAIRKHAPLSFLRTPGKSKKKKLWRATIVYILKRNDQTKKETFPKKYFTLSLHFSKNVFSPSHQNPILITRIILCILWKYFYNPLNSPGKLLHIFSILLPISKIILKVINCAFVMTHKVLELFEHLKA